VKLYVGITDFDWFSRHASKDFVEEVNFWRPSSQANFKVLQRGEPFLFKLHTPRNYIVGGGFFLKFLPLPLSLAWAAFREGNGARSLEEVRTRIAKYRRQPIKPTEDPIIGCTLLGEPFFFDESEWIPSPSDFKGPIVSGKSYDMEVGTGLSLWREVTARLSAVVRASARTQVASGVPAIESPSHGTCFTWPCHSRRNRSSPLWNSNSGRSATRPRLVPGPGHRGLQLPLRYF
jgi:putative restriction endonuclease